MWCHCDKKFPSLSPEFVHHGDEKGNGLCDEFAGVALVILDGDGPLLFDPLQGSRAVQPVPTHKRLYIRELFALNLKLIDWLIIYSRADYVYMAVH